jgi:hypothetical protein
MAEINQEELWLIYGPDKSMVYFRCALSQFKLLIVAY